MRVGGIASAHEPKGMQFIEQFFIILQFFAFFSPLCCCLFYTHYTIDQRWLGSNPPSALTSLSFRCNPLLGVNSVYSFCDIWHALIFCTIQDAFHPAKWWWRMAFSSIVLDILGVCNENTIFVTPLFKKKSFVTTGVEEAFMECFKLWEIRYLFKKYFRIY